MTRTEDMEREAFKTRLRNALKFGQATFDLYITEQLEWAYKCRIGSEEMFLSEEELMECFRGTKGNTINVKGD